MSSSEKTLAVMALNVVATRAAKLAYDLEHNRLWEGELSRGLQDIETALRDVQPAARNDY